MQKDINLVTKLNAIGKISAMLKNVVGDSGKVIDVLKKTQEQLLSVDIRQKVVSLAQQMRITEEPARQLTKNRETTENKVVNLAQQTKAAKKPSELLRVEFSEALIEASRLAIGLRRTGLENKALSKQSDQTRNKVNALPDVHQKEIFLPQKVPQALDKTGISIKNLANTQGRAPHEGEAPQQSKELNPEFVEHLKNAGAGAQEVANKVKTALGGLVQTAMKFEDSMNKVGAMTNAAPEDLAKLTTAARKYAVATGFTDTEVSQSMQHLAQAGFDANQVLTATPGLLNLAQAGSLDLAKASAIASGALSAMGMDSSEMGRMADVLSVASLSANTDVLKLGEALKVAGGPASHFGGNIEQVTAMLGKMADAGIKGGKAGTALADIYSRLSSPTEQTQKALSELDVKVFDDTGKMRDMPSILKT